MANNEMLGLLCASTTAYGHAGGSTGDKLTRTEFAMLLSSLSPVCVDLAMAKYCLDQQSLDAVVCHVADYSVKVASQCEWKLGSSQRQSLGWLSAIAVHSVVSPCRCDKCKGTGITGFRLCRVCEGSGYLTASNRRMAAMIGVERTQWLRIWRDRYHLLLRYVQDIDSNVTIAVSMARVTVPF